MLFGKMVKGVMCFGDARCSIQSLIELSFVASLTLSDEYPDSNLEYFVTSLFPSHCSSLFRIIK